MKVTGYQLKEAIKMNGLRLVAVQSQFDESLYIFEGEEKRLPKDIVTEVAQLEADIALLQTAQDHYNLNIDVIVGKEEMALSLAVKLVGGAGRRSKMWRSAAQGRMRDTYDRKNPVTRSKDEEVAGPTVTKVEALEEAMAAEKFASQLRHAIAVGNTSTENIDWIDENLFG